MTLAMDISSILYPAKNAYGFIPFSDIDCERQDKTAPLLTTKTCITFGRPSSREGFEAFHGKTDITLENLATCVQPRNQYEDDAQSLYDLASQIGPLFGQGCSEFLLDWAYAASTALVAVNVQQMLNKGKGIESLLWTNRFHKYMMYDEHQEIIGSVLHTQIYSTGMYDEILPHKPICRSETQGKSIYRYALAFRFGTSKANDVDLNNINICVFQFRRDFTSDELAAAIALICSRNQSDSLDTMELDTVVASLNFTPAPNQPSATISLEQVSLAENDAALFNLLVKLLVDLHLANVRVDMFSGAQESGFLSFDCALAFLWYRFAQTMSKARIGYCQYCGKAFSTAGHRGIPRRYCSDVCRTKAKNARSRRNAEDVRKRFLSLNQSVSDIAVAVYSGSRADRETVREQLESWKHLRDEIEASINDYGWEESPLWKRCISEGLSPERLLRGKYLLRYQTEHNPSSLADSRKHSY